MHTRAGSTVEIDRSLRNHVLALDAVRLCVRAGDGGCGVCVCAHACTYTPTTFCRAASSLQVLIFCLSPAMEGIERVASTHKCRFCDQEVSTKGQTEREAEDEGESVKWGREGAGGGKVREHAGDNVRERER